MEKVTGNSMISITKKEIGERQENCVNGRDLHAFLGIGKRFPTWITDRIAEYDFQQGQDFEVFPENGNNPQGCRPYVEYSLTLDMAKELCMIERNEKGRIARKYFIECEKRLRAVYEASASWDEGRFTTGLRTGIALSRALDRNGFNLADAAALTWYRKQELTQVEAAMLFGVSRERIQEIEKVLKGAGVILPVVNAQKRSKAMRGLLNDLLGFKGADLRLLQGGAL